MHIYTTTRLDTNRVLAIFFASQISTERKSKNIFRLILLIFMAHSRRELSFFGRQIFIVLVSELKD